MADYTALKESVKRFVTAVRERFRSPFNAYGQMTAFRNGEMVGFPAIRSIGFVETDEELNFQQNQRESFETIFDSWQRIARLSLNVLVDGEPRNQTGSSYSDEGYPPELDSWSYDPIEDAITCTVNSISLAGFISNERYNNYVLEARVSSTSGDNDFIGLCLAHAADETGRTHTLTAMRQLNGRAPLVIDKNYWSFDASEYEVQQVFSGLLWSDGSVATGAGPATLPGWDDFPTGVVMRITREEDLITVETSQIGESTYFEPAKTVIDLAADPELEVFRGPQRYGYVCVSQPNSTWEVLQRSGDRQPIVDVRDLTYQEYENGSWVTKGSGLQSLIDNGILTPNWLHFNPITGRFYYLDDDNDELIRIEEGS